MTRKPTKVYGDLIQAPCLLQRVTPCQAPPQRMAAHLGYAFQGFRGLRGQERGP